MKPIGRSCLLSWAMLLAGLAMAPLSAQAALTNPLTAQELAMLPEYCKHTQGFRDVVQGGNDPQKIKYWASVMGDIFQHMHHHCEGLQDVNYAKFFAKSDAQRKHRLSTSVLQFDYVIRSSRPDEKLLPEFLTKKGESLATLGNGVQAVTEFSRAIEIKPDYWPPYAAQSDYYKGIGNIKLAREILQQGLAASPDARALSRRLSELESAKGKPSAAPEVQRKPPATQ